MTITLKQAAQRLIENDNILILSHRNPDGDTLGCGSALMRALAALGKNVRHDCNDKIPEKFSYLFDGVEKKDFKEDFIVSVDVAERRLLGDSFNEKYGDMVDLSFDHHGISKLFAKETYCESGSASACEVIYLLIKELGVKIDSDIASFLYTGMSTDTGCFRYSNVTPRTHRIAAALIESGADHARINVRMFETKSMNDFIFQKMCLDNLKLYGEGKIALITVTRKMLSDCSLDKSALDAIKPITRQIEGVEIGITVKEEDGGNVGVSLRTGENYDAAEICAHFGGGGHMRAAGCQLDGVTVSEAEKRVIDFIVGNVL